MIYDVKTLTRYSFVIFCLFSKLLLEITQNVWTGIVILTNTILEVHAGMVDTYLEIIY